MVGDLEDVEEVELRVGRRGHRGTHAGDAYDGRVVVQYRRQHTPARLTGRARWLRHRYVHPHIRGLLRIGVFAGLIVLASACVYNGLPGRPAATSWTAARSAASASMMSGSVTVNG